MPAWKAGLRLGDLITRINNREDKELSFTDIRLAVALSQADVPVTIEGLRDGKPFKTAVTPIAGEFVPQIYVEPTQGLVLPEPEEGEKNFKLTSPGLSASRAEPPLLPGDEIKELDESAIDSYAQLALGLAGKRNKTVELGVRRKGAGADVPLTKVRIEPNHFRTLGLRMAIGQVTAVQPGSPADGKIKPGDTITHILAPDQKVVGVEFDPLRLPDYFAAQAGKEVRLRVKREVSKGNPVPEDVTLVPDDRPGWIERPSSAIDDCPLSIPAIGVAYHILHHVVAVEEGGPAELAGIHPNDNLQEIRLVPPKGEKGEQEEVVLKFREAERSWPTAFWLIQQLPDYEVVLVVMGQGAEEVRTVHIDPESDADWYLPMRGFVMKPLSKTRQAENIGEAVQLGFHRTRDSIIEMWFTIKGLFSRRISPKAIGGPIRIFGTAMFFTKQGIPDLILFLGILSVSLAVLNFLPIPVLDGGHFMFLCWEGIRGKPPSEKVVVTATYVGLALVLSLMLFVMYNDIAAFFPKAH
jgi:regulator of sigma E protease